MFDLEKAIAEWRSRMLAGGINVRSTLDELESHLREEIEEQSRPAVDAREAFEMATRNIGQPGALKCEFAKAGGTIPERMRHFILTMAGIPDPQLATAMNDTSSNSAIDPGWATYLKGTVFVTPAMFLWVIAVIFVMPRVAWICHQAGWSLFGFDGAPAAFRDFATIGSAMVFLTAHGVPVAGIVILTLILLEWRASGWPRYRRAAVGAAVFVINFAVIVSITLMLFDLTVVVPGMIHHAK
jgi:hypothetical protein